MFEYTAVISGSAGEFICELEKSFDVLCLPAFDVLQPPVRSHADMLMFSLNGTVILPLRYHEAYPHIAEYLRNVCALRVLTTEAVSRGDYPFDVALNVLVCRNYAFSLSKHTSPEAAELIRECALTHVSVKQGYSACSTLALGHELISADPSVLKAAKIHSLPCLEISSGGISLAGYNEGFIGGASGVCGDDVYFLGNIN